MLVCSPVASSIVTTRSQTSPVTQRWVLASWCTIIPGKGARSRLMRCLPRALAFLASPAPCSTVLTQL